MADETSSLGFLRRHSFWWFLIGPAGAAGSVWGKRLGEDRPLLGHIVFTLGLVLIAIGHGWAINWAYVRLARHHQRRQRRDFAIRHPHRLGLRSKRH
jgi:hypothetical protein